MAGDDAITLLLCGDVMTGRGVDQALPFHCAPGLHESYVSDARDYLGLAEDASGPIPRPVRPAYLWGEALAEIERAAPDLRLVNLETSVTTSGAFWVGKEIHYRMHPGNVPCLTAAGIQCCALANNHVLDWGYAGLLETLGRLAAAGVKTAGAGRDLREAQAPAVHELGNGRRILVFGMGAESSGIPPEWAAGPLRPGVDLLPDLSRATAEAAGQRMRALRRPGDLVVASIHWGPNWGFETTAEESGFAHALVDSGGVDVVHGHSSHHVRAVEVYREKLILYGCGDLLDDYEGIRGYEAFRGDLGLLYFAQLDPAGGRLLQLELVPTTVRRFQVVRAGAEGTAWLRETLDRLGQATGTWTRAGGDGRLRLGFGGRPRRVEVEDAAEDLSP
ncbi:MAG TPA: CapA family protein [Myxococcales bacterium]|jgi:poly-gamma-glutamate synthesis protein (capsule biosynthesis protein)